MRHRRQFVLMPEKEGLALYDKAVDEGRVDPVQSPRPERFVRRLPPDFEEEVWVRLPRAVLVEAPALPAR